MTLRIQKSDLSGQIEIPASKSHTLRAILFAALAEGRSRITRYLPSTDAISMIEACRAFGARIQIDANQITVDGLAGQIEGASAIINAGNSGIVLRFCAAVAALSGHPVVVTGDHSIQTQRPVQPLLDGLVQLGVSAASMKRNGFAPILIQGPLKSGIVTINGEDSQPVSALLIAAAFAGGATQLHVKNPGEKPWVGLTLDWFDRLGIGYENRNFETYRVNGNASYRGFDYSVPGDFSSAAFPIAAALITQSELSIDNIDMHDSQGDKEIIHILRKMGAEIEIDEASKRLRVKKGGLLKGITIDINSCIDALPILAVVGCFAEGETRIVNGAVARQKECNRIRCSVLELQKMGAQIEETADGLFIKKSALKGGAVYSHHDHRMAMSLAVAGMAAEGTTEVASCTCLSKTYPEFVSEMRKIGACMEAVE